ncbi:peptidylprolyl isomerase [Clostridium folliculivorans]|uniref:Peptidylprolyl isomerase n=1 Tax=Clostridium folliculivorans TaxID=2886038 RepID=A0A9W5Y5A8_9CLOT|nr:peptidylprolyl isomerase [Clostridium folliculivorans]GKU26936.1 peptidylprolyl isomerase [Clostridium folliculivorans]GKU31587.1 peptidylprolyl isomerase [Clostridium folliculivorans]
MDKNILAVVGGNEITEKDLMDVIERYPENRRGVFASEMGRKQLLEQVISFELLYKFGVDNEFDKSQEFLSQMEKVKKDILTQIIINKVLSEVTVTDEEALKYYEDNKEAYMEPETVSAKHILLDSEDKLKEIREDILSGKKSFEQSASEYSTCPSSEQGGDLGAFSKGMMVPEFEEAAFNLPVGEVSEPVKTQFGFHLIKVASKNSAVVKSFDEVKKDVVNELIQQRQERKYLDFVQELAAKYGVERK